MRPIPIFCSNSLICLDTAGWEIYNSSAALEKLLRFATSWKTRIEFNDVSKGLLFSISL
jgi:hypothetical protein